MSKHTRRTLHQRTGREGPQHDPYSYVERTVRVNGWALTLHAGLGEWFKVDGKTVDDGAQAVHSWEVATGITTEQFDKAYDRVHPYFEDPMGHPSMYE